MKKHKKKHKQIRPITHSSVYACIVEISKFLITIKIVEIIEILIDKFL
jgi:hypothetical protein